MAAADEETLLLLDVSDEDASLRSDRSPIDDDEDAATFPPRLDLVALQSLRECLNADNCSMIESASCLAVSSLLSSPLIPPPLC